MRHCSMGNSSNCRPGRLMVRPSFPSGARPGVSISSRMMDLPDTVVGIVIAAIARASTKTQPPAAIAVGLRNVEGIFCWEQTRDEFTFNHHHKLPKSSTKHQKSKPPHQPLNKWINWSFSKYFGHQSINRSTIFNHSISRPSSINQSINHFQSIYVQSWNSRLRRWFGQSSGKMDVHRGVCLGKWGKNGPNAWRVAGISSAGGRKLTGVVFSFRILEWLGRICYTIVGCGGGFVEKKEE